MSKKLKSAVKQLLHQLSELNVRVTKLEYPPKKEIELLDEKKELVAGKWYKGNYYDTKYLVFPTELHNGTVIKGYGFDDDGSWCVFKNDAQIGKNTRLAFSNEVESALIEEAKRRYNVDNKIESFDLGEFKLLGFGLKYNQERNILYASGVGNHVVFSNGKWAEVIEIDKFAELKEAHKNGAVIQYKGKISGTWYDIKGEPKWENNLEYRIKPEEKPKVVWKESLIIESHNYETSINQLVNLCHGLAKDAGWHDKPREVGTMLALIHSEVSEAMEGFRKDLNDDHLTSRKMAEVELADAVIRIFDLAGAQGFDLGGALVEKLVYNTKRADHKIENRQGENGKKF